MEITEVLERWARWVKQDESGLYWPTKTFIGACISLMPSNKCVLCQGKGKVNQKICENCDGSGKIKFRSTANKINPAFIRSGLDSIRFIKNSTDELSQRVDRVISSNLDSTQKSVLFAEFVFHWKYHYALRMLNMNGKEYGRTLNSALKKIEAELT